MPPPFFIHSQKGIEMPYVKLTTNELAVLAALKKSMPVLNKSQNGKVDLDLNTILKKFDDDMDLLTFKSRILKEGTKTVDGTGPTTFEDAAFTLSGATHFFPASASAANLAFAYCNKDDNALSGSNINITLNHSDNSGIAKYNYIHVEKDPS